MTNGDTSGISLATLTDKEQVVFDNAFSRSYAQAHNPTAAMLAGEQAVIERRRIERVRREAASTRNEALS